MPLAAAAPYIVPALGGIGGALFGRQSAKGASQPSPNEQAGTAGQSGAAGALAGTGRQLTGMGVGNLQQSGGYFSTLAGGNRAATTQALAPDIENLQSVYGGTARTLSRFMRGPERDTQMAELSRERAGQIGSLFRNARPAANAQLASMGGSAVNAGTGATAGAGSLFGQQVQQGMESRFGGAKIQEQAGADFGGLLFNLLKNYGAQGGKSGGV